MATMPNFPIVKDFSWSPLIRYVFQKNLHHFISASRLVPRNRLGNLLLSSFSRNGNSHIGEDEGQFVLSPTLPPAKSESLPLLAIHLRRGDFIEHCDNLVGWNSTYHGYNTLPSLPDRFFAENTTLLEILPKEELRKRYREKCLVDIDMVRKRVVSEWREQRLGMRGRKIKEEERVKRMLRKVYVMTNGDQAFLEEQKDGLQFDALRSSSSRDNNNSAVKSLADYDYDFVWDWDEISTSRDLDLHQQNI